MRDSARSAIRDRPSTAEIRQPLGYAMVGGLIVSQVLTLFTTPVIYLYMDRLRGLLAGRAPGAGATVGELPENPPISS